MTTFQLKSNALKLSKYHKTMKADDQIQISHPPGKNSRQQTNAYHPSIRNLSEVKVLVESCSRLDLRLRYWVDFLGISNTFRSWEMLIMGNLSRRCRVFIACSWGVLISFHGWCNSVVLYGIFSTWWRSGFMGHWCEIFVVCPARQRMRVSSVIDYACIYTCMYKRFSTMI